MSLPMKIMHLTASPFYGGPERVIMDIVRTQATKEFDVDSLIVSFRENGGCDAFLHEIKKTGFRGQVLKNDMPHLIGAIVELIRLLRDEKIDLICAHGHKSRLVGWVAARRVGIPIVGVSHGWTWQDWKTSLYERLDQWMHRRMDRVVCVSQSQADKVVKTGTPENRIKVIYNAIDVDRFQEPFDPTYRKRLESYFEQKPEKIIGAAGRLSPEKGFDVMIEAIRLLQKKIGSNRFGVVLFGEGFLRESLQKQIDNAQLSGCFKMVGFTSELDRFLPHFNLFAQSSHTEGFPCVNLEAMAARIPVVATAVGGVPEQIRTDENGRQNGLLVPPNDSEALAGAIAKLLSNEKRCRKMGDYGREIVFSDFTCQKQARSYYELFQKLI